MVVIGTDFKKPINPSKPLLFLDLQFLRNSCGEITSHAAKTGSLHQKSPQLK
jgi:hypothetical protein